MRMDGVLSGRQKRDATGRAWGPQLSGPMQRRPMLGTARSGKPPDHYETASRLLFSYCLATAFDEDAALT